MTDSDTGKKVLTKDGRRLVKALKRMAWDNKVPVGFRLQAIDRLVFGSFIPTITNGTNPVNGPKLISNLL